MDPQTDTVNNTQATQQNTPIQDLPVVDGTNIPTAADSQSVNAVDPNPTGEISFESGNFQEIQKLGDAVSAKTSLVEKTVLPLIEASLIELLGKSSLYKRESFEATPVFSGTQITISCSVKYHIDSWIATDVNREFIAQDASYVYNRIKVVPNVSWSTCEIDTTEGSLTVEFTA